MTTSRIVGIVCLALFVLLVGLILFNESTLRTQMQTLQRNQAMSQTVVLTATPSASPSATVAPIKRLPLVPAKAVTK